MTDKEREQLLGAYWYEEQVRSFTPLQRKMLRYAVVALKKKKAADRARTGILILIAMAILIIGAAVAHVNPFIVGGLVILGFVIGIYVGLILLDIL